MIWGPEEWDIVLGLDDFAAAGAWALAVGGAPGPVRGIFTRDHLVAAGGDFPGVSTTAPAFAMPEAELPTGAAQGDTLTIGATVYRVADIQPDGAGLVRVILEA